MIEQSSMIWLSEGKIVYPPTEQPDEVSVRPTGTSWIMLQTWFLKYNPHKVGSQLERECPTCSGHGYMLAYKRWRYIGKRACPLCTDGTQKRRIVSVELVEHIDFASTLESADDVDRVLSLVLDGHKFLILADTERAKEKK